MENIIHRMENIYPSYIKTDNNKIINEHQIRWIKKINECLEVCTKSNGCTSGQNTHPVCRTTSSTSYEKLNKLFN